MCQLGMFAHDVAKAWRLLSGGVEPAEDVEPGILRWQAR